MVWKFLGRNFWTSGKYNQPTAAGKGVVIGITGTTVTSRIEPNTKVYRHICEAPASTTTTTTTPSPYTPNTQPEPAEPNPVTECQNPNDVIVLLDSSGSIGAENYKKEKVFAYDLGRAFADRSFSRFGFTIFSYNVKTIVPLDNALTQAEINSLVLNADFMASTTNTDLGIDSAVDEYAASTRNVQKNLVVVTDGASNNPQATIDAADNARGTGMRIFAVGIGSGTSYAELLAIAGGDASRVYTTNNYDGLTAQLGPLSAGVCNP